MNIRNKSSQVMRIELWTRRRGIQPPALQIYSFIHANSSCFYPSHANMSQEESRPPISQTCQCCTNRGGASASSLLTHIHMEGIQRHLIIEIQRLRAQKEPMSLVILQPSTFNFGALQILNHGHLPDFAPAFCIVLPTHSWSIKVKDQ